MSDIKLQCLAKPELQSEEGIKRIAQVFESLGFKVAGMGRATLTVEGDRNLIEKLSGRAAAEAAAHERTAPASGTLEDNLPIPEPLKPFVESISVPPKHQQLKP